MKEYTCKKCKGKKKNCKKCSGTGIDPVLQPGEVAKFRDYEIR